MIASVKARVLGEPFSGIHLGPYLLHESLGRGSAGVVYSATDTRTGERVAVKTLHRGIDSSPGLLLGEFRAACELDHPNLVRLFEINANAEQPYIVMELVEGENLVAAASRMLSMGDHDRVVSVFGQLADGLAYLHDCGLVHSDIKPGNALVDADGRVTILDFGLACGRQLVQSAFGGTPGFLAPERTNTNEGSVESSADVFALGQMIKQTLASVRGEAVPPVLRWVCTAATDIDPSRRPSAGAIAREFGVTRSAPQRAVALVGREQELSRLHTIAKLGGQLRVACVVGTSGSGKTTLMRAFSDALEHSGWLVLRVRSHPRDSVPLHAVRQLVEGLRLHLNHLDSSARSLIVGGCSNWLYSFERENDGLDEAAFELKRGLRRLAATTPVLVWLDDLQWIDGDSARVLQEVLHPPGVPDFMLVGCTRPLGTRSSIAHRETLRALDARTELVLGRLDDDEARALAHALAPGSSPGSLAAAIREADGDPYALCQLVCERSSVSAQLRQLSARARRMLQVIATAGSLIEEQVAVRAAGLNDGLSVMHRLALAKLITYPGDMGRVEVYHARVRAAVLDPLDPNVRKDLHGALADALLALRPADHVAIATHLDDAGRTREAGPHARAAAEAAARLGAHAHAAALMAIVCRATEDSEVRRAALLDRARLLARARRPVEAAEVYLEAAGQSAGMARVEARRAAAYQLLNSSEPDRGIALLRDVLPAFGLSLPATTASAVARIAVHRARLWARGITYRPTHQHALTEAARTKMDACLSAAQGLITVDVLRGAALHAHFTLLALESGEPKRVARALALEAATIATSGIRGDARARRLMLAAGRAASIADDAYTQAVVELYAAVAHLVGGRWRLAVELARRAHPELDALGASIWEIQSAADAWLNGLRLLGSFKELRTECERLLARARRTNDRYALASMRAWTHMAELTRDDPEAAHAEIDAVEQDWSHDGFSIHHITGVCGRARVLCYERRYAEALHVMRRGWSGLRRSGMMRIQMVRVDALSWRTRAALGLLRLGRDNGLIRLVRRGIARLERESYPGARDLAVGLEGTLALHRGDGARAERAFRAAAAGFEASESASELAAARMCLAELVSSTEARHLRALARAYYEEQGVARPTAMAATIFPTVPSSEAQ